MISAIVTVGPNASYKKYLDDCLDSLYAQEGISECVIIDGAAHLNANRYSDNEFFKYKKNEWNLGQAASINIGCAVAANDWLFIMGGSDDIALTGCVNACYQTYQNNGGQKWACYSPIIITSEGETSSLPQGAWLIHRSLWSKLGGYPPAAGIGEVDAIFASIMLKQNVAMYSCGKEPLYWHREHLESLTATKSPARRKAAEMIRGMCTREWQEPTWAEGYGFND